MRYDVFLVSALTDSKTAEMLARRLRALKFKVRHDKKRAHTTPTPKDIKDANNSQSIIVVWSEASCDTSQSDSDWVHAMAHQARSRKGALLQVGLDTSVPDEPFDTDARYQLDGLTARKTTAPYLELVDELGRRDGRKGLRAWMALKASDKDGKQAWISLHPTDPLSVEVQPKPVATPPAPTVRTPPAPTVHTQPESNATMGKLLIGFVFTGIAALFLAAYINRSAPAAPIGISNAGPQFIFECPNGERMMCPIGTLEPTGPIIDDTE